MQHEAPSLTRVLVAALVAAVLLVLVGAGATWFVLADEGIAPPPSAVVQDVGRTVQTGGGLAEEVQRRSEADRIVLQVVDGTEEPVEGVTVRLVRDGEARHAAVSDGEGRLTVVGLRGDVWWEVEADAPWTVLAPATVQPTVGDAVQTVLVHEVCGGPIRFVLPDGRPFEGKARDPVEGWKMLEDGRAEFPNRLCGRGRIRVAEPKAMPFRIVGMVPLEVVADELVEVTMPAVREAQVQTLDEAGRPIDVRVFPGRHLGTGRYGLRGRDETRTIEVQRDGGHVTEHEIPLDGGTHALTVPADRAVALTLLCDSCPQRVTCLPPGRYAAESTCEGEPPELTCRCPGGAAVVYGRSAPALLDTLYDMQPLGRIPPGETAWEIDATGDRGAIEATWLGPRPCDVGLTRDGERVVGDFRCGEDGGLLVSDLFPGAYTLTVTGPTGAAGTFPVQVGSGQTVQLGALDVNTAEPRSWDTGDAP